MIKKIKLKEGMRKMIIEKRKGEKLSKAQR